MAARKKKARGGYRAKAGRKAFLKDAVSVTVDLEAAQAEALRRISEQESVSVAYLVREAVKGYLGRRKTSKRN